MNDIKLTNKKIVMVDLVQQITGFSRAYSVGADIDGNIYIPDFLKNQIFLLKKKDKLKKLHSVFEETFCHDPKLGARRFDSPHSIVVNDAGEFFITEMNGNRVSHLDKFGRLVKHFGSDLLISPVSAYLEKDQHLYVSSWSSGMVYKFNMKGMCVGELGGGKDGWFLSGKKKSGNGSGYLDHPHAARLGPDNNIYIVDQYNHRIVRYTYEGKFFGWTGARDDGSISCGWCDDGKSISSHELGGFNNPIDLIFDLEGNMFITDCTNNRIVIMTIDGISRGVLMPRRTRQEHNLSDKLPDNFCEKLNNPYGIVLVGDNLYVADRGNERIAVLKTPKLKS
jgi:sugar lactone lactonase YvrE